MMMTVFTRVRLREGAEPEWDAAMGERLEAARSENGWINAQILIPIEDISDRVIIGTWATRADWERWHTSDAFSHTREQLKGLESGPQESQWYECTLDLHSAQSEQG